LVYSDLLKCPLGVQKRKGETMVSLNGMAHLVINVSQWNDCKPFYKKLMPFLGMEQVFDGEEYIYFVGSRTAVGISRCSPKYEDDVFEQRKVGLHHFCLRSKSKEDVDAIYKFLVEMEAKVIEKPRDGEWAPGYYFVLFEDPIGTRIEVNYVPGKGVLADGVSFTAGEHYR